MLDPELEFRLSNHPGLLQSERSIRRPRHRRSRPPLQSALQEGGGTLNLPLRQAGHPILDGHPSKSELGSNSEADPRTRALVRSAQHPSELQSLMRISYAVFCLKKKKNLTHR